MNLRHKFYTSRDPVDSEIILISEVISKIDLKGHLTDNFIYILMKKENEFEVLSFQNEYVFEATQKLNVNNKMAIEYLIYKIEICQNINKILYENNIGGYKKYKAVKNEKLTRKGVKKVYHNFTVYDSSQQEAMNTLAEVGYNNYLYLHDVSKEKK